MVAPVRRAVGHAFATVFCGPAQRVQFWGFIPRSFSSPGPEWRLTGWRQHLTPAAASGSSRKITFVIYCEKARSYGSRQNAHSRLRKFSICVVSTPDRRWRFAAWLQSAPDRESTLAS
jgi:hypothetical protein